MINWRVANARLPFSVAASYRGVLIAATIALAARFISEHHGGPALLYALLLGMVLHFLSSDERLRDGIELASGTLLRLGVVLIGARISFDHMLALGLNTTLLIVAAVLITIAFSAWLGRRLGWPTAESALAGGAVAVCGASAAVALAAALPAGRAREQLVLLVVIGVTALSTLAMLLYPLIARAIQLPPDAAGVFIGGTIHDVAQVVGAGYLLGQQSGDAATLTKMLRVAMLAPLVLVFVWLFSRKVNESQRVRPRVPPFLLGFAALMTLNSAGLIPAALASASAEASRMCVLIAIAALGMRTSLESLKRLGWTPLVLLSADTALIAGVVLLGVLLLR